MQNYDKFSNNAPNTLRNVSVWAVCRCVLLVFLTYVNMQVQLV